MANSSKEAQQMRIPRWTIPLLIDPEDPKTYNRFRKPESTFHRAKYDKIMRSNLKLFSGKGKGRTSGGKRRAKVLEIGCGTGVYTGFLVRDFMNVTATDLDASMCKQAKKRFPSAHVRVANAQHLPFKNCSFDEVFGVSVLHHIPDCDKAFREMARVLKQGGWFVFCEPNQHNPITALVQFRYGERGLTRRQLKMHAKRAGLHVVEIGTVLFRSPRSSDLLSRIPGFRVAERIVEKGRMGFSIYILGKK